MFSVSDTKCGLLSFSQNPMCFVSRMKSSWKRMNTYETFQAPTKK